MKRVCLVVWCLSSALAAGQPCETVTAVGKVTVFRLGGALVYWSGLAIDADGAPNAYAPGDQGLDHLANAGRPGNWWGLVTERGEPVVQGPNAPFPGYYVSATALEDRRYAKADPRRYVDSTKVPYVVLPPALLKTAKLGDLAAVINEATGAIAYAQVADVGPSDKLGEGSIALAAALGVPSDPKRGGASAGFRYVVFPKSGTRTPLAVDEVARQAQALLADVPAGGCDSQRR